MYVSTCILYCYNVYAFGNKNIETYTVFLTNSCPHDVIMYGAHMGAQQQTAAPLPDSTFAIQTYGCFSFIGRNALFSIKLQTKSLIILHETAKDHM